MTLERKFHRPEAGLVLAEGVRIEGYASLFGVPDQGGDV
ncbi:MAG: HK97 family phage prohead protease, partial [Gemmobacter sp.]